MANFDAICNENIEEPERLSSLVDIYLKIRQFVEDSKEIGKAIGTYNGESPNGEWWEFGGRYDE